MNLFLQSLSDYIKRTDLILWLLTLSAVVYSFLLILSMQRAGDYNYLRTQLIAVISGLIAAVIISLADYRFFIKKWYWLQPRRSRYLFSG